MKIGNISFNLDALKGMSREQFIQHYRGQLDGADIDEAYDQIQTELNKNETKTETKEIKKPRNK